MTDVAIVGGGPVGMALAILLGQRGREVDVLERWPTPYPLPRAVHFDDEVGRILQSCGIGDELRRISEPADLYEWRNGEGRTLLRLGRQGDGPSGWPVSSMFNQPALEALLADRADHLDTVTVHRGAEVTALDQDEAGVSVTTGSGSSIRADYAIGCDGANSTVRAIADLPVTDLGFRFDWLIVDVVLAEPRVFDPINLQICDPARPTTVVSGGPGHRRWEFMRLPEETIAELDDEQRAWELLAPWDVHPGNATLERHATYTFGARYADQWRRERILLAGDAAHLMPPFAGQGLCSGLRDAANLAWKLDHVLAGAAGDRLLDTYGEERLPGARNAIDFSVELGRIICVPDPQAAAERDEAMASAVTAEPVEVPRSPGLGSGLIRAGAPHAGELFVQGVVDDRPFDDVEGAGWRLVTTDPAPPATPDWFAAIGGSITVLHQPDAAYQHWFADHGCTWALQRPDFHLYGTATTAAGADRLLVDLRHHLTTGAPT